MTRSSLSFPDTVLPIDTARLATHGNPVTCVLAGRRGPLTLVRGRERVTGEILLVRPGIEHGVVCSPGGARVLYLNGLSFPADETLAWRFDGKLALLAMDAMNSHPDAARELRAQLGGGKGYPAEIATIAHAAMWDPMERLTQIDLAQRLKMERTKALRYFKAATGLTFRDFKRWSGLQFAARQMLEGASIRTAALDAGFADTAHLSRTFRLLFGLTPSDALTGLQARHNAGEA
ncbi:MAG: helix-turn-helix transcriptional regulator [Parvibaculum sp.]|nr:helix-turn-helix transcriptional regulator [Parvibaculum sp.]